MGLPDELFISHSSADHAFVGELAATLRRHGVPVWFSGTNILGAQQWHDAIGAALHRCDWFAIVLSPRAVESMWVTRELHFALQQESLNGRIVPLLIEPCDTARLSWVLSSLQIIDFSREPSKAYRQLLRIWGLGYQSHPDSG
jgi:hypothetical protein